MDIRIVNTCNNNCLYCLEKDYRNKEKYIDKNKVFELLKMEENKKIITFYGGNPLLHPDIVEIVSFCKKLNYSSIGILSNTGFLDKQILDLLINNGLNSFGFYFNSFNKEKHDIIVNSGIDYNVLINNIKILINKSIYIKTIIHINKQNIENIFRDIFILYKKFGIKNFEFINYFPFGDPFELFASKLQYSIENNREYIDKIFKVINKLNLNVKFSKFSKNFFGKYLTYYNFELGVKLQLSEEDFKRINNSKKPFCYYEKRCQNCYIIDICK